MENINFYFLSKAGTERDTRMINRFNLLNLDVERVEWVSNEWLKSKKYDTYSGSSCQFGHLKILKKFVDDNVEYGCVFEDDVFIHKNLKTDMPKLIDKIKKNKIDILLIGYLINYKPYLSIDNHKIRDVDCMILDYPDNLWGSQSYILTRPHAIHLLNKYNESYLDRILNGELLLPFKADFTVTKDGNRALVYPMYVVEEGETPAQELYQKQFHKSCMLFNYNSEDFI